MPALESLRMFCRVVELGGFARAARELEVANASVTNHITRLERHFGVRLLNRTTRRLSLTDDGWNCYQRAKRVLGDVLELEESLSGAAGVPKGLLRVSVPIAIGSIYLAPALPAFAARYPELSLKMSITDRVVNAIEEGVDALVRIGELKDSSMVARTVHRPWYACGASPAFVARHGMPKTPEDLARFACMGFSQPSTGQSVPWVFEKNGKKVSHTPAARVWLNHAGALIRAAEAGGGIIQLLSLSMHPPFASGSLLPVLEDWRAPGPPVSVIYPQQGRIPEKVRVFAALAAEVFQTSAAKTRQR